MKKLIGFTGCLVIFCLLINGVLLPSLPSVKAEEKINTSDAASSISPKPDVSSSSSKETYMTYILKSYKGKIAVFKSDSKTPVKITDTEISKLPKDDQLSLTNGIEVEDELELNRLLEDYCS